MVRNPEDVIETWMQNVSRRTFMKTTGVAATAAALGSGSSGATAYDGVDIESKLEELTVRQKAAQMTQVAISSFDPQASVPERFGVETLGEYFSKLELGSILSGGSKPPSFDAKEVVQGINALQEYNLNHSSSSIPFLWGVDAVHGNGLLADATVFPQRINMGSTRDVDLLEDAARHTADSTAAMGAHWTFAPTNELQRDPRWGRFFEGITEDPMLLGAITRARVRGLESNDRLCSTDKHFAGYSIPESGNDRGHAQTSMRDLRTNLLPPHRMALEEEPKTVMVNSGAINGKPAHVSSWLLTEVLREQYDFEGVVISDYNDFNRLIVNHDYTDSLRQGIKEGINAGVDMYMIGNGDASNGPVTFIETVADLVEKGEISTERIDEAVRRILELKAELGLFQTPTVEESRISDVLGGAKEQSEQLAKESMVLLKNENDALPLSGSNRVLLTGPGINPNTGLRNRFMMQHGGWTLGWQGVQGGYPTEGGPRPRQNTILETMNEAFGSVAHVPTSFVTAPFQNAEPHTDDVSPNGNFGFTDQQESKVKSEAARADAVVVVLGEGPHNEGFGDRDTFELAPPQRSLVEAVTKQAPDTPVVGVILAGSPQGTAQTFDMLDAVLFAGQPGSDTGRAVTDTLLGKYNPSGKLAFNWPASVGKVPNHYNQYPPLDDQGPLYEFGHGLSYTTFEYSNASVSPKSVLNPTDTPTVTVSVDVANTGEMAGDHIVEVYNTQSYGSVLQPKRRLIGFKRVSLDAGTSTTVEIEANLAAIEVVPGDVPGTKQKVVEAGAYELSVGDSITTTLTIENTGSVTKPRDRGSHED
ncbi:glycoside hydrolase family 3 protein [Halocatena pleomorpha]|uniref:beta-glucosidase n=1 Tax=Halocatena pleomorpha TaxID=1785090 RepID=A0A3P3RNW3_9EURY|nr:glycoside hydrolase family 3 N-terminal domain-containing protein [Halocatena pleomorpha]RRJ34063.1 twin-arginine translocation signal domain-containing protein [Halocatena pleomorpha]